MLFTPLLTSPALDVALQDYTKYVPSLLPVILIQFNTSARRWRARMNPGEAESEGPSPHIPTGPKKDYTLKEGQTFSISIPGRAKPTSVASGPNLLGGSSAFSSGGGGGIPALLPPPPSAPRKR